MDYRSREPVGARFLEVRHRGGGRCLPKGWSRRRKILRMWD